MAVREEEENIGMRSTNGYDIILPSNCSDVSRNSTATFLVIDTINYYYLPFIVLLGTVGNLLSLAVFRCTKLRQLSTSYYLTALSLSDTGCLLPYLATWLDMIGYNVYNRPVCCQLLTYMTYVCGFMSPWFVVAFTVERFVATCYPLRRAIICTVSRAQAVVVVLTVIAATSYLYILYMTEIDEISLKCELKEDHFDTMNILNILDTIATLVIPVVLITGLNLLIVRAVWQFEKVRRNMTMSTVTTPLASSDDEEMEEDSRDGKVTTSVEAASKLNSLTGSRRNLFSLVSGSRQLPKQRNVCCYYQLKITKMLLMISTVFVGLNAPSYIMRLWVYFGEPRNEQESIVLHNLQQWSQLLFNLNFAINFLLYCVSGQNFRRSLRGLFFRVVSKASRHRFSRKNTASIVTNSFPVTTTTVAAPHNLNSVQPQTMGERHLCLTPCRASCLTDDTVNAPHSV